MVISANNISNILKYSETRYVDLDGGKTHRSFQLSMLANSPTSFTEEQTRIVIAISAPKGVITNSENPALDLATFFGNFGGYLTICGVFGFLFGSGKMSPFGFVTDYCFPVKDRESLMKNFNNGNDGNDSEKINPQAPEAESKTLLNEYYVDMELFTK